MLRGFAAPVLLDVSEPTGFCIVFKVVEGVREGFGSTLEVVPLEAFSG
jgi:hypothetical protein